MTDTHMPKTMRAVMAAPGAKIVSVVESAVPVLGPTDILMHVQAATLNYHDLAILKGAYGGAGRQAFTPGSDASGIVVAAGVIRNLIRLEGVTTGPRSAFEAMNRAIETARMTPVIDSTYAVSDINAALDRLASGEHFGKIVIDMSS